jgi:hypothetical protein
MWREFRSYLEFVPNRRSTALNSPVVKGTLRSFGAAISRLTDDLASDGE